MNYQEAPSYPEYLPPLFLKEPESLVIGFLRLFEALMAGLEVVPSRWVNDREEATEPVWGLEQLLDRIHLYSDSLAAPGPDTAVGEEAQQGYFDQDFLDYLAGWVALSLRKRWPAAKKRRLIQNIVPLYKKRGTYDGIAGFLKIFVESPTSEPLEDSNPRTGPRASVDIQEELGLQVGVKDRASVGFHTVVGGWPHFFRVRIRYGYRELDEEPKRFNIGFLKSFRDISVEVVDLEKPAHTAYRVVYSFPGIVVGKYSRVDWDTLIWSPTPSELPGGQ